MGSEMVTDFQAMKTQAERERRRTLTPIDAADEAHGDFPHILSPLNGLESQGRRDFRRLIIAALWLLASIVLLIAACSRVFARDDGRYAASPLKLWFDGLQSGTGLCCSFADGAKVENVDWDTVSMADAEGTHIIYRVRLNGAWLDVPPNAVVTVPNRFGAAVVWPYKDENGATRIRCFMPGAEG